MAKRSEVEAERSKAMASSSLVLIDSTHKQQKQELVAVDGGAVIIVLVGNVSPAFILVCPLLGSKLAVNKKRAVHLPRAIVIATIRSWRMRPLRACEHRWSG